MKNFRKIIALTLFLSRLTLQAVPVQADEIWNSMKAGSEPEAVGDYETAVGHWIDLVGLYETIPSKMDAVNYAMFLEKIGDYYAGIFGVSYTNRPLAVTYYDRSTLAYGALDDTFTWGVVQTKNKANALRTTIEVFVEETISRTSIGGKYIPATGAYLGMYAEQDRSLISGGYVNPGYMEDAFGKNIALQLLYSTFGESRFPTEAASRMGDIGGGLQIAMEPSGGLSGVTDSTYIRQWAADAKASGIPVFLRFAGEMNGAWVVWGEQPDLYIEKFRLIHDIMAESAPNVVMLWSPNDVPYYNMMEYYPGDAYVDWVGISTYCVPDGNGHTDLSNYDINPMDKLKPIYDLFAGKKPIMLSESAVAYEAKAFPSQDFTPWYINNLEKYYHYIPRLYPAIKGITYFNRQENYNSYMLSENPVAEAAYKKVISSDYFLEDATAASPVKYTNIDGQTLEKGTLKLSTYASIYDPFIGKVLYLINGKPSKTLTEIPYEFAYDFSSLTENSCTLEVQVYDTKGQLTGARSYELTFKGPRAPQVTEPVPENTTTDNEIVLQIDNPLMSHNGTSLEVDEGKGTAPVIIDNRTMIPIRAVVEKMGGSIGWEGSEKKVTVQHGDTTIDLWIGNTKVRVNGSDSTMDTAPVISNNRTLLPVRFITENLGAEVQWIGDTRQIVIRY